MKKTSPGWGGKQANINDYNITKVKGYLGSNNRVIELGMAERMFFDSSLVDVVPFHISAAERNAKKKDREV